MQKCKNKIKNKEANLIWINNNKIKNKKDEKLVNCEKFRVKTQKIKETVDEVDTPLLCL